MNSLLLVALSLLVAGYACRRFGLFEPDAADVLHRFVIYICLPALIWKLIPTLHFEPGLWSLVCVPWLLLGVTVVAVRAACARFGWSREIAGALLLCIPIVNSSFLGFPMTSALLGEDAVKYAVVYDQLGTFVPLATYGLFIVAYYGGGQRPTPRDALLRMLRFPPFVAFALAFTPLVRFESLQPLWARLGDVLVPVAMFAVGLRLEWRPPRPRRVVVFGLTLKLLVMPLLAYGIACLLAAPPAIRNVAVLEAGMPASVTAGALAMQAGLAPELAAALVGYGVLLSMLTLPAIAMLLHSLS